MPKGVPLEPGQRALAVHVEDHPLDYAAFEGEIPAGQYGAGTVEIWDRGTYELVEEKKDGGLTVRLDGERLQGLWTLVPAQLDGNPKNWLILRKREDGDGAAVAGPLRADARHARARTCRRGRAGSSRSSGTATGRSPTSAAARRRLVSRNGNDLTERFRAVAKEIARAVKSPDCVLDGEVCALDEQGRPSFSAMQQGKPGRRSSTRRSTCSSSRASRSSTCR